MRNLSIVIPACDLKGAKNRDQLTALLDSVKDYPGINETLFIVVCFDGCKKAFISDFVQRFPFIVPVINAGNRLNFARNANLGFKHACRKLNSDVVLVNQDCILPCWEIFKEVRGEGVVTTQSINLDGAANKKLILDRQQDFTGKVEIRSKFPFYCVFINKDVVDKIGFLDGVFIACFEDDDYITRALLAGFKVEKSNVKIYHEGSHIETTGFWESASGSYNLFRLNLSKNKYTDKWKIPLEVTHDDMINWVLDHHEWQEAMAVR